jgi:hypothetical protein
MTIHVLAIGGRASGQAAVVGLIKPPNVGAQLAAYINKTVDIAENATNAQEVGAPIAYSLSYLDGTSVAEVASVYGTPHSVSATELVHASVRFHTNDDDKNDDTELVLSMQDASGAEVARYHVGKNTHWNNGSDNTVNLALVAPRGTKDLIAAGQLIITEEPSGNDTWRFDADVNLQFSDGSQLHGIVANRQTTEKDRTTSIPFQTALH